MLATPKPTNLKQLINYLEVEPHLKVSSTRIKFESFANGTFKFDDAAYNFVLRTEDKEMGIEVDKRGFSVSRMGGTKTSFTFCGA